MFEKIVTNAHLSPSLQGQLAIFARKQRQHAKQRLMLVVLSFFFLITQCFGLFLPHTTAGDAANGAVDDSSITSKQALLARYDTKRSTIRELAGVLSITRKDLETVKDSSFSSYKSMGSPVEWSLSPTFVSNITSTNNLSPSFAAKTLSNKVYYGHTVTPGVKDQSALLYGHSDRAGDFAVMQQTGNFISSQKAALQADTCKQAIVEAVTTCPNSKYFQKHIVVKNITYKTEAQFIKLHPGDQLLYSLNINNMSSAAVHTIPEIYVGDILEYASLSEISGAHLDKRLQTLSWPKATVEPFESQTYTFTVRILSNIPLIAQNPINTSSYDCKLSTFFGTTYSLRVACPYQKVIERAISPPFNPIVAAAAGVLFLVTLLSYIRSCILHKELVILLELQRKKD